MTRALALILTLTACERPVEAPDPTLALPSERASVASTGPSARSPVASAATLAGSVTGPASVSTAARAARTVTWNYAETAVGEMSVVVHVPAGRRELPVLIAMHGWGEALKGPKRGARGWFDDYGLGRALQRLKSPPLTAEDFEGYVDPPRLARINESLAKRPFRGLVIVCPYTPRAMMGGFDSAEPLAAFLVDELLPRVRTETPALPQSGAVGIDGVSLGGRSALLVGFERPNSFGMIASLQAAFYPREVSAVVKRGKRALEVHPQLKLRLLTSSHDGYRGSNKHIAERLRAAGAVVRFDDIPGPHTYAFNRGPAVYEMLLMHDRALRGEPYLRAP